VARAEHIGEQDFALIEILCVLAIIGLLAGDEGATLAGSTAIG
jgi:prepilin-type N-terminal cleavage/methylation domain-containing protein